MVTLRAGVAIQAYSACCSPRPAIARARALYGDRRIGENLPGVLCGVPGGQPCLVSSAPAIEIDSDGAAKSRFRGDERCGCRETVWFSRAWPLRGHVSRRLWRGAIGHAAA